MPRFIQYDTAKNARSITRTGNNKAFIVVTKNGKTNFYPNSNYNNAIICSARSYRRTKQSNKVSA